MGESPERGTDQRNGAAPRGGARMGTPDGERQRNGEELLTRPALEKAPLQAPPTITATVAAAQASGFCQIVS